MIADPEVRAFVAATEAAYGALPAAPTVAEERAAYNRMCAAMRAERPEALVAEDRRLATPAGPLALRRYVPAGRAAPHTQAVYLHGGGFILGGLESHDDICAEIAHRTGLVLTAVDYRLAPEHPHPAAYDDALAAVRALGRDAPLVLVGDSAGGALAASVAIALRHDAQVRGQVLIYPGLGGHRLGLASYSTNAEAPLLRTADLGRYTALRAGGAPPMADPTFEPLAAPDLSGAAPCFASAADADPLRDDAAAYVARLSAAGVAAEVSVEAELPHGWLRARHHSARAAAAFGRIIDAVARLARPDKRRVSAR